MARSRSISAAHSSGSSIATRRTARCPTPSTWRSWRWTCRRLPGSEPDFGVTTGPRTIRPRAIRIGIDIGGTFTDLQILDEASGALHSLKTPTTPDDPSIGLMTAIVEAASRFGFRLDQIGFLLPGTTIATNAVLERKLPRGALIATAGVTDFF